MSWATLPLVPACCCFVALSVVDEEVGWVCYLPAVALLLCCLLSIVNDEGGWLCYTPRQVVLYLDSCRST